MNYRDILSAFKEALAPVFLKLEEIRCALAAPAPTVDEEQFFLCDPISGARVRVLYQSGSNVPVSMTYLDGTPYGGTVGSLVECDISDTDPVCFDICVNGVNYRQCVLTVGGQPTGLPGDIYYLDINGVLVATPVGTIVPGICGSNSEIRSICRCDDVNGDGSLIVTYTEFYTIDLAGVITIIANYTDLPWTPYVPVNPVDCNSIGTTVSLVQQREHLTGPFIWNRPGNNIESLTIKVRNIDPLNPPTITDRAGRITPLFIGDVESWGVNGNNPDAIGLLIGGFTITSSSPSTVITLLYTEYV